jgi:hypothetical protein
MRSGKSHWLPVIRNYRCYSFPYAAGAIWEGFSTSG